MTKKAPAPAEEPTDDAQPQLTEEQRKATQLFTEQFVDMAVFAEEPVEWGITDVNDNHLNYLVPSDLPFPVAMTFMRAMDRFERSQVDASKRNRKLEEARLQKAEAEWNNLLAAFLPVLELHRECSHKPAHANPKVDMEALGRVGASLMKNWMDMVKTRLHLQRAGADTSTVLLGLLGVIPMPEREQGAPEEDSPKA
jgi:hypothetical protein